MSQTEPSASTDSPYSAPTDSSAAKKCEKLRDASLTHCWTVKRLIERIAALGCPRPNMNCAECNAQIGGGFEPQNNIVLCCNRILDQSDMDNVLTHELIHAYDGCRVRNLDWHNAHHLACSEIRAANLSKDCSWWREMQRGKVQEFRGQQATCIKRRAVLSLMLNPSFGGKQQEAETIVNDVFPICSEDWAPFQEIP